MYQISSKSHDFSLRWQYNHFQHGSRPPSWICCDVIILLRGIHFHVPNIVENFYIGWFCITVSRDPYMGVKSNPMFGFRIHMFPIHYVTFGNCHIK